MTKCPVCNVSVVQGAESTANPKEYEYKPCHFACWFKEGEYKEI